MIPKGSQEIHEIFFRVLIFDCFTKIETWKYLDKHFNGVRSEDFHNYENVLNEARENGDLKGPFFTSRFQNPSPFRDQSQYTHLEGHLLGIQRMIDSGLCNYLLSVTYLEDAFDKILEYPGKGDFMAFQLLIVLTYTKILGRFSPNDFVALGPGAQKGLRRLFHERDMQTARPKFPKLEQMIVRRMAETQDQYFAAFKLDFPGLGPDSLPMTAVDVEHTLCEVCKYVGDGRLPTLNPPSKDPLPSVPALPEVWALPSRQISRPRPPRKTKRRISKALPRKKARVQREEEEDEDEIEILEEEEIFEKELKAVDAICNLTVSDSDSEIEFLDISGTGVQEAVDPEQAWEVDHIVDEGVLETGEVVYLVRWTGFEPADDTWEPASELKKDAPLVVRRYLKSKSQKSGNNSKSKKRKRS